MLDVRLQSTGGHEWELTGSQTSSEVIAPAGSLMELRGMVSRSDMVSPGRAGARVGRPRFDPIRASIDFYLHNLEGKRELSDVVQDFRRGWSLSKPCVMSVDSGHPLGTFYLDLYLDKPLPGTRVDTDWLDSETITADVVAPKGLFRSTPSSGTGSVTVTNYGDSITYPWIVYSGAGGEVISPSGARFKLPSSTDIQTIHLDPSRLRLPGAFPEGVNPGESGAWVLPPGARLVWVNHIADPWG